jgi:hypothetical protein
MRKIVFLLALLASAALAAGPYPQRPKPAPTSSALSSPRSQEARHRRLRRQLVHRLQGARHLFTVENEALLAQFVFVHVNVGDKGDRNQLRCGASATASAQEGVPALAVLEPTAG